MLNCSLGSHRSSLLSVCYVSFLFVLSLLSVSLWSCSRSQKRLYTTKRTPETVNHTKRTVSGHPYCTIFFLVLFSLCFALVFRGTIPMFGCLLATDQSTRNTIRSLCRFHAFRRFAACSIEALMLDTYHVVKYCASSRRHATWRRSSRTTPETPRCVRIRGRPLGVRRRHSSSVFQTSLR